MNIPHVAAPAGVKHIAGRVMKFGTKEVQPGDTLTKAQVASIAQIDAFISAGYIYLVTPAKGYDQLPPHVFNSVRLKKEADTAIRGASGLNTTAFTEAEERAADDEARLRSEQHDENDREFETLRNEFADAINGDTEAEEQTVSTEIPEPDEVEETVVTEVPEVEEPETEEVDDVEDDEESED